MSFEVGEDINIGKSFFAERNDGKRHAGVMLNCSAWERGWWQDGEEGGTISKDLESEKIKDFVEEGTRERWELNGEPQEGTRTGGVGERDSVHPEMWFPPQPHP